MVWIDISLLTNGTEQIFTFSFKEIAMQIPFLLWSWVASYLSSSYCKSSSFLLFLKLQWGSLFLESPSHYPAFFNGTVCYRSSTVQEWLWSVSNSTLPRWTSSPLRNPSECCASSYPQTSFLPLSEPLCNLKTWEHIPLVFGLAP